MMPWFTKAIALGLPLIGVMDLEALSQKCAKRKQWEFMLTVTAPPILGAGFSINPIATF
jgi:hypothetical protein